MLLAVIMLWRPGDLSQTRGTGGVRFPHQSYLLEITGLMITAVGGYRMREIRSADTVCYWYYILEFCCVCVQVCPRVHGGVDMHCIRVYAYRGASD